MEHEDIPTLEHDTAAQNGNAENDSDFTDDDYEEDSMEQGEATTCLFCPQVLASIEMALEHIKTVHNVNFSQLKAKFHMDQYQFIKLINCIRLENVPAEKLIEATESFWNDEKYLKPKDYEPWLSYDYDDLKCVEVSLDAQDTSDLKRLVQTLQQTIKLQQSQLEQASQDIATMRLGFKRLLENDDKEGTKKNATRCVSSVSVKADSSYFDSYAHFGIHHEMLSDTVRTSSYRNALLKNKDFVKGKYVLDVGCGTSVLSIFAAQAGAEKVIGIDNSDIIYNAMDIVKKNNIENVSLIRGRLEDTALPIDKFDIIISEWMGYFLLFEGMLDSVIYARDKHLKENGILLPNRCTMSIVGYGNDTLFQQHVTFWDNVYGIDMSNMRKEVMHEPLISIVDPSFILTESNCVSDINLMTVDLNYSNFKYDFELKCCKDGMLSSFVGYFDNYFDLPEPIMFGTSPNDEPTHWKQVVFFLDKPQVVKQGDVVKGVLHCKRSSKSARSLDIFIEAFDKKYTYYLD